MLSEIEIIEILEIFDNDLQKFHDKVHATGMDYEIFKIKYKKLLTYYAKAIIEKDKGKDKTNKEQSMRAGKYFNNTTVTATD